MQWRMATGDNPLEQRLLAEIGAINRKIADLERERTTVERMLIRLRRENVTTTDVTRVNSAGRVLVEQTILKRLSAFKGLPVLTADLKRTVQSVDLWINDNTFRSHLNRLRQKGLIESAGHGRWRAVSSKGDSEQK